MTGMSADSDLQHIDPALPERPANSSARDVAGASNGRVVGRSIRLLEHMQDSVTAVVGLILIALASVLLVSGIVNALDGTDGSLSLAATDLLDRVLFVLILVEIVHTVVLSLQSHRLVAQPFIVVGLIAVIRRILFVLTPGSHINASTSELALLIGMVAVFVAGLIAVSLFEKKGED